MVFVGGPFYGDRFGTSRSTGLALFHSGRWLATAQRRMPSRCASSCREGSEAKAGEMFIRRGWIIWVWIKIMGYTNWMVVYKNWPIAWIGIGCVRRSDQLVTAYCRLIANNLIAVLFHGMYVVAVSAWNSKMDPSEAFALHLQYDKLDPVYFRCLCVFVGGNAWRNVYSSTWALTCWHLLENRDGPTLLPALPEGPIGRARNGVDERQCCTLRGREGAIRVWAGIGVRFRERTHPRCYRWATPICQ